MRCIQKYIKPTACINAATEAELTSVHFLKHETTYQEIRQFVGDTISVIETGWICITSVPFLSASLQDSYTIQDCVIKKKTYFMKALPI